MIGPHYKTTQVAESVPFDNSTNGFVSDNVQGAIEEAGISGGSSFCYTRLVTMSETIPSGVTCFARNPILDTGVAITIDAGGEWYII